MKTLVFSLFIFLSVQSPLIAQEYIPFPDTNTRWCEGRWFDMGGGWPPADTAFWFLKTNGKMSINDTIYTILDQPDYPQSCFIREEAQKVYFRYSTNTPEFMIFDFTLEEGDSVNLPLEYGQMTWPSYVVDVDSVLIGSQYHKRIFINAWIGITFIEGVGCEQGMLYFEIAWVDWSGFLKCFSLNDTIYDIHGSGTTTPGHCWLYLDVPETRPEAVSIYPNPAKDFITILLPSGWGSVKLTIVDLLGRVLRQETLETPVAHDIRLSSYEPGIYLCIIQVNSDIIAQKLVIQ